MKQLLVYETATGKPRWTVKGSADQLLFDPAAQAHAGLAAIEIDLNLVVRDTTHAVVGGALSELDDDAKAASAVTQAWFDLRCERHRRLSDSDARLLPDRWAALTDAQRAAWCAYRQALRDLPTTTTDPTAPTWPVQPA